MIRASSRAAMGATLMSIACGVALLASACRAGGAGARAGGAATSGAAGAGATAGVSRGLCENACDKYIACGGARARTTCVDECVFIYAEDESLTSLMAMQCAAYVSYIDGPKK